MREDYALGDEALIIRRLEHATDPVSTTGDLDECRLNAAVLCADTA
jgi:hypothetical protein